MSQKMSHQMEVLKLEKTNLSRPEQTWAKPTIRDAAQVRPR